MRPHAVVLVGVLALLAGCLGGTAVGDDVIRGGEPTTTDVEQTVTATFEISDAENVTVTLEVADSRSERRTGLMFRESLPKNHGMVFVYDDAARRSFWMKNTYVPLDIIFLGPNQTVLNVEHAHPQPNASDLELASYPSDGDAMYVVELRRGFANRTGVEPGTELVFDGSAPVTETPTTTNEDE